MGEPRVSRPVFFSPPVLLSLLLLILLAVPHTAYCDVYSAYENLKQYIHSTHVVKPNVTGDVIVYGDEEKYRVSTSWDTVIATYGGGATELRIASKPAGIIYRFNYLPLLDFSVKFETIGVDFSIGYNVFSLFHHVGTTYEYLDFQIEIVKIVDNDTTQVILRWRHYRYNITTHDEEMLQDDYLVKLLNYDIETTEMRIYIIPLFYQLNGTMIFGFTIRASMNDEGYIDKQIAWEKLIIIENTTIDKAVNWLNGNISRIYGWTAWIGLGYLAYREPDLPNVYEENSVPAGTSMNPVMLIISPKAIDISVNTRKLAELFVKGELIEYTGELLYNPGNIASPGTYQYLITTYLVIAMSMIPGLLIRRSKYGALISGAFLTALTYTWLFPDIRIIVAYSIGVAMSWLRK